jgi:hypothetical protein
MEGDAEEWWEIWRVRALDLWACRKESEHLSKECVYVRVCFTSEWWATECCFAKKEWQEGPAATNLSHVHERLSLWEVSWELGILLIWVQSLRRLLERKASGFWVSRCWEWEQCIEAFKGCGLVAQRTEWTQRDLTSKGLTWNSYWIHDNVHCRSGMRQLLGYESNVRHKDRHSVIRCSWSSYE